MTSGCAGAAWKMRLAHFHDEPRYGTKGVAKRGSGMIRFCLATALASAIAINLAGCDRQRDPAPQASATAPDSAEMTPPPWLVAPSDMPSEDTAPDAASKPQTAAESGATPAPNPAYAAALNARRDPGKVLAAWATAVEARDWASVRAFWGDHGQASGLDPKAFALRWGKLVQPRVTIDPGESEGAAGSIYYTAPVTIIDGARRLTGEVVLRRVNDVPGATPEQLRWHIESTTLAP